MRSLPAHSVAILLIAAVTTALHAEEIGNSDNGRSVFLADGCFECHGRAGEGGYYNYPVPALAEIRLPLEAFKAIVRLGPNDMPAYGASVLSDAELADIYAFLRALPGPRATAGLPILGY